MQSMQIDFKVLRKKGDRKRVGERIPFVIIEKDNAVISLGFAL